MQNLKINLKSWGTTNKLKRELLFLKLTTLLKPRYVHSYALGMLIITYRITHITC
jgi:hypothetical protein